MIYQQNISSVGISITNSEIADVHYVSLLRANDLIKKYFYPKMPVKKDWVQLRNQVNLLPRTVINDSPVIDLDQYIEIILNKYRTLLAGITPHIQDIYNAIDVYLNLPIDERKWKDRA